jgi:pyruvate/2-oxoglutarate/acetoin dehydrogenase E1 component/TPP-dependent pyruvate/acetoin dehydrogenase alpha subunit
LAKVLEDREQTSSALHLHDAHRHIELGLTERDLAGMHRTILVARRLDERIGGLKRAGKAAFVASCQGHEGAQVGSAWAIRVGHDTVLPSPRDTGVVLTLGMTPYDVLLGVFARPSDPSSGGRQMPNHWGSRRLGIITGSSPIATHVPHAAGIALASKMGGGGAVAVAYVGDGAASKGDFHESLEFAGVHRLPLVLVCEDNGENIAEWARTYRFPGVIANGSDPLDVYAATSAALARARHGEGPTLIECRTGGRTRDPLARMRQYLIEHGLLSGATEVALEAEVKAEVDDAAARAEAAAPATGSEAFTRVFARPLRPLPRVPAELGDRPELRAVQAAASGAGGGVEVEKNVIETVRDTLQQLMAADERVVVLGEDVGPRGGVFRATDGLYGEFGEQRVLDMPLAESSIVGVAIGLALAGLRPIAEIQFADFIHSAFDQLVSEAAKIHYHSNGDFSVPMVVRTAWGGGVHGALYHSQAIEAFYAHVPGLKVVAPSTPADVAGMLREAVDDPDPVLFLEHKKTYRLVKGIVPEGDWRVPIGVAEVVVPGDDLTVVTYGLHRHLCTDAAALLAAEGISAEVVDLRTISPLDRETVLASVARTGRLLIVHEDNISFGVGAEVASIVAEEAFYDLDGPIRRLAMPDVPAMPFAAPMEAAVSVTTDHIVAAIRDLAAH